MQEKQQTVGQVGTKNKEQDAKIAELTASLDAAGLHIETLKTQGATLLKNIEVKTMELQQIQLASTNKVKAEA